MDAREISRLHQTFEDYVHTEGSLEYWYARDLQGLLEYTQWRNFEQVIDKAKVACQNSGQTVLDHFADVSKTIPMPKGAEKEIDDLKLTRYACYLIAQNGDPKKSVVAFAQTYFALQTRKQELLEERFKLQERLQAREQLTASEKELSRNIYQRGVDHQGFARIRSQGDHALFGGHNTSAMKDKLGIPKGRALADFLPTVTIAAKNLATEITNHNVTKQNLRGERSISSEHITNNRNVRKLLGDSGIQPERLPPEEDIKKLERRVKSQEKTIATDSKALGEKLDPA